MNNILNKGIFTNIIYYTEFANGDKYIGQTRQGLLKRNIGHLKASKPTHYDKVLQKHMKEAVIYPIAYGVEEIEDINTIDLLNGLEVAEIMLRETFNDIDKKHGLNHTTGGYSFKRSEAHKNKIAESSKKFWDSEAGQKQKEKDSKNKIEFWNSEEGQKQKNKTSEKSKKYWESEEGQKQKKEQGKNSKKYWESEKGQRQKEKLSEIGKQNNNKKYWESEEGQRQKEKLSNERRNINIENILSCIEKYISIKEVSKKFNTPQNTINTELRKYGFPSYQSLRNEIISEDLINSGLMINEFSIKHNIKENDIKTALTKTGKKYLIKKL